MGKDSDRRNREGYLKSLLHSTSALMEALSHGRGPEPSDFHTPAALHHAFLSAVHFAVGYNPTKRSSAWRHTYLNECRDRMTKGMHQITKDLEEASLEYREAILPLGLVGALLNQIMHDVDDRHHLIKTYRDYLYRLVNNLLIYLNVGVLIAGAGKLGTLVLLEGPQIPETRPSREERAGCNFGRSRPPMQQSSRVT